MRNALRRLPLLLIVPAFLSACVTEPSDPGSVCPVPVEYSREFQDRMANELDALPDGAALTTAMVDYGRLRAELRACRGGG